VQVLQPALLALASHRVVAIAWVAGAAGFAGAFLLPVDPVTAATIAQLVAGLVTTVIMAAVLLRHLSASLGGRHGGMRGPVRAFGSEAQS
jgi:hypothetical protein